MSAWLQRQRKGELVQLADEAGLKDHSSLLKDDLIEALDKHLRANSSKLDSKPSFQEFYESAGRKGSPVKKERTADPDAAKEKAKRRRTKVKEELEEETSPGKTLAQRTPRAVQRVAARVPLPPSPAVVSDWTDRKTAALRTKASKAWSQSGVNDYLELMREALSSVHGVELVVLGIEAYALRQEVLPQRYAFDIPATRLTRSHAVTLPDLFLLVTSFFWSPTTLWASTSVLIPLLFAYFFNFTVRNKGGQITKASRSAGHTFDPLTFNIAKALVSYLVYSQGVRFNGFVADITVNRVESAIPGGYKGILIGAAIGGLSSVYDAVLKK